MMTRKDYIEVARIIRENRDTIAEVEVLYVEDVLTAFADMFKRDNTRFDRDRFFHEARREA